MKKTNFMQYFKKLVKQRNIFLALAVVLAVAVGMQSFLLMNKSHRTVVVPTQGQAYWIEDHSASKQYTEQIGAYLTDMLLTRSPADVQMRNEQVIAHVHPRAYHTMKELLRQEQQLIISQQQSHVFRPELSYVSGTTYITEGDSLVLVGKSGDAPVISQQEKVRYRLQFQVQGGKLMLTGLKKESANA